MSSKGLFAVVIGIDGSGKTTIINDLQSLGMRTVTWSTVFQVPELKLIYTPERLKQYREIRDKLKPCTRACDFLEFFSAQYEYLIKPFLEQGETVIVDSYYYKQLAKEETIQRSHSIIRSISKLLPDPDIVFFLEIPASVAFDRKDTVSKNETRGEVSLEAFCSFQGDIAARMEEYIQHLHVIRIDASLPTLATIREIVLKNVSHS